MRPVDSFARVRLLLTALALLAVSPAMTASPPDAQAGHSLQASTWTIVAVDPETGDVGVAGASCVPNMHGDGLAALVPGKGAAATQAYWELENRNKAFQLLLDGHSAEDIIIQVSDPAYDAAVGARQYGVVTLSNGSVSAAAFTGKNNHPWAGDRQDSSMGVTVQGNLLVGEAVVADSLEAFQADEHGYNTLPDRLMRALEAGSAAGGDVRCNNDQVTQTAATAFILVARGTDQPYATRDIGITDQGTANAPYLRSRGSVWPKSHRRVARALRITHNDRDAD
jgi:uncharacterized Ntn-hydrolase superfamily protein